MLLFLIAYGTVSNMIEYGYGVNDAFWRFVWAIDEETIWAESFSEKKFLQVKVGMEKSGVESLLGNPLNDKSDKFWCYTWNARGNADFDQRWIVFDTSNKVSEIRKSFFID